MKAEDRRKEGRRRADTAVEVNRRNTERRSGERRQAPRVPLELWMEEAVGEEIYFRRTGNVSLGGVFLMDAIPHQPGTEVTLKFTLPGDREMVVARGSVVNNVSSANPLGMRVRFVKIEGDGKARIRNFIASL